MGPVISRRLDATSLGWMKGWVEASSSPQSGAPVFADVRDVARAHILAAETPGASGRYIVAASHTTPASTISAWLQVWGVGGDSGARRGRGLAVLAVACLLLLLPMHTLLHCPAQPPITRPLSPPSLPLCAFQERFPEYEFPEGEASEPAEKINNSRVQAELGLALTPVKETLTDMAATLIQLGLAQPKPRSQ